MTAAAPAPLLAPEAFVARLREEGVRRYHDQHPFHELMPSNADGSPVSRDLREVFHLQREPIGGSAT